MNLSQFAALMERRATIIPQRVAEVKKQVASVVLQELVQDTPIDTGAAKSNWVVNLGSAYASVVPPHAPGHHGSTAVANVNLTLQAGLAKIAASQPGIDIHITNNLYYIGDLNRGTSTQAPAGFVEAATIKAAQIVRNARVIVS